jgi:hypothetical protein
MGRRRYGKGACRQADLLFNGCLQAGPSRKHHLIVVLGDVVGRQARRIPASSILAQITLNETLPRARNIRRDPGRCPLRSGTATTLSLCTCNTHRTHTHPLLLTASIGARLEIKILKASPKHHASRNAATMTFSDHATLTYTLIGLFSVSALAFLLSQPTDFAKWVQKKKYQYEVTFSLYMLTPTEKFVFSMRLPTTTTHKISN